MLEGWSSEGRKYEKPVWGSREEKNEYEAVTKAPGTEIFSAVYGEDHSGVDTHTAALCWSR